MEDLTSTLVTQGGIALVVSLIIALLVKNPLKLWLGFPADESEKPSAELKRKYSILLNTIAGALAIGLALAATALTAGLTGASALSAVILGLFGAASAVGVSEFGSNTASFWRK